jgi:predicted dehydrogenase
MADRTQGGALLTSATHSIDICLAALGPVDEVTMVQDSDPNLADADTVLCLGMHHKAGGNSGVYVAWRRPPHQTAMYYGPNGLMYYSLMDDIWAQPRNAMHFLMMRSFLHYAESGDPGRLCTLEQARQVMEVVDAARKAWAERGVVRLP